MINVTVLAFDYALASALTGINDLLSLANTSCGDAERLFQINIASWNGKPVKTLNNLIIQPHCAIQDIKHTDVYLVPTILGQIDKTLAANPHITDTLRRAADDRCLIGSNSTGSFFLAEAGLLDGKTATTHWSMVDEFRRRYPMVKLKPEQMITHDGNILTDGGGMAWFDLGLYLVEFFMDHKTAANTAKFFVIDIGRTAQLTYSPLISKKYHNDTVILEIQNWMEENFQNPIVIEQLGQHFGLSNRSLIRRFKAAAGCTPSGYLQQVRLDVATKYLVQTNKTIEEITHAVGYEDVSSFTRLYKRSSGLSPSSYRARFKPIQHQGL